MEPTIEETEKVWLTREEIEAKIEAFKKAYAQLPAESKHNADVVEALFSLFDKVVTIDTERLSQNREPFFNPGKTVGGVVFSTTRNPWVQSVGAPHITMKESDGALVVVIAANHDAGSEFDLEVIPGVNEIMINSKGTMTANRTEKALEINQGTLVKQILTAAQAHVA